MTSGSLCNSESPRSLSPKWEPLSVPIDLTAKEMSINSKYTVHTEKGLVYDCAGLRHYLNIKCPAQRLYTTIRKMFPVGTGYIYPVGLYRIYTQT